MRGRWLKRPGKPAEEQTPPEEKEGKESAPPPSNGGGRKLIRVPGKLGRKELLWLSLGSLAVAGLLASRFLMGVGGNEEVGVNAPLAAPAPPPVPTVEVETAAPPPPVLPQQNEAANMNASNSTEGNPAAKQQGVGSEVGASAPRRDPFGVPPHMLKKREGQSPSSKAPTPLPPPPASLPLPPPPAEVSKPVTEKPTPKPPEATCLATFFGERAGAVLGVKGQEVTLLLGESVPGVGKLIGVKVGACIVETKDGRFTLSMEGQ